MDIARYAIKNPVNIWLLVIVFLVGGAVALGKIGRLEDPAFTIKQVQVVTQFPGASAEKVEREITEPLEIALQQMPQLKRLTSISKPGISEISVEVQSHFDSAVLPQIWDELTHGQRGDYAEYPSFLAHCIIPLFLYNRVNIARLLVVSFHS